MERVDDIGRLLSGLTHLKILPSVADQLLPPNLFEEDGETDTPKSNVASVYSNIPRIEVMGTKMTNLKVLWISRCQVKDLRGIQFSPSLQELYASFNQISCLDPLGALQHTLEVCDLEGNRIKSIEDVLHNFGNSHDNVTGAMSSLLSKRLIRDSHATSNSPLRTLTVSGNPFTFENHGYRVEILRHLPHLQLLDDTDVRPDELSSALSLPQAGSSSSDATTKRTTQTLRHVDPSGEASLLYSSLQRNMFDPLKSMLDMQHRDLRSRQTASSAVGGSRSQESRATQKAPVAEPTLAQSKGKAVFRGGLVRSLREAASSQPASTCSTPPAEILAQKHNPSDLHPQVKSSFTPSPPRAKDDSDTPPLDEILSRELTLNDDLANICNGDDDVDIESEVRRETGCNTVRIPQPQSALLEKGLIAMYHKKGITVIFDTNDESPLPSRPECNEKFEDDLDRMLDEVENGPSPTPTKQAASSELADEDSHHPFQLLSSADILVEMQREKAKTAKAVLESALYDHSRGNGVSPRSKIFASGGEEKSPSRPSGYEAVTFDDLGDDTATFDEVM